MNAIAEPTEDRSQGQIAALAKVTRWSVDRAARELGFTPRLIGQAYVYTGEQTKLILERIKQRKRR